MAAEVAFFRQQLNHHSHYSCSPAAAAAAAGEAVSCECASCERMMAEVDCCAGGAGFRCRTPLSPAVSARCRSSATVTAAAQGTAAGGDERRYFGRWRCSRRLPRSAPRSTAASPRNVSRRCLEMDETE